MAYPYLPGTTITTLDGGLVQSSAPTSKPTVILGTSASGVANSPFQVADQAVAQQTFGLQGTLVRTMAEVAQGGCDNILLYRIGTKQATLANVGTVLVDTGAKDISNNEIFAAADASNVGFTLTFGSITPTTAADYQVYYSGGNPSGDTAGILEIYFQGNLVYSNDPTNPVNTGDCQVDGAAVAGVAIVNSGVSVGASRFAKSLPLSNSLIAASVDTNIAAVTTGQVAPAKKEPALVLYLGDTGLSLTPGSANYDPCKVYEALQDAYDLLATQPIAVVVVPNAYFDAPSVAFYANGAATTDVNNPANGAALGWLNTTYDVFGNKTYRWAHKVKDSGGHTVTLPTFVSASDRLAQGFHEVSFGYQLARFAAGQSSNEIGCIGFIGCAAPKNYKLAGLRTWIGSLPGYKADGKTPSSPGNGLLGNAYLTGTTSSRLNTLCADISTQAYRLSGYYQTNSLSVLNLSGEYDEPVVIDKNGYNVDIGAYIHVFGGWGLLSNSYSQAYAANLAGIVAGRYSSTDPKTALTNQTLPRVTQIYRLGGQQMNDLDFAKINELKFKGDGVAPAILHDRTAARLTSDFTFVSRQAIKFLVTDMIFQLGDAYIGKTTTDSLTISALETDLETGFQKLLKGKYISRYTHNVYTTAADQSAGRFFITTVFTPAFEIVQLQATVAFG